MSGIQLYYYFLFLQPFGFSILYITYVSKVGNILTISNQLGIYNLNILFKYLMFAQFVN